MKFKKPIYWLMIVAMLFTLVPASAFAATDNYAAKSMKVKADDEQELSPLVIREDEDSEGFFEDGDVITVTLPEGVEYTNTPSEAKDTIGAKVYGGNENNYVKFEVNDGCKQYLEVVGYGENYYSVKVVGDRDEGVTDNKQENKIIFYFKSVDIPSDFTGEVKVEIEAPGTGITSEFVTVARVIGGDTVTTVSDVKTIGIDSEGTLGTIRITENVAGVLKDSAKEGVIELELPNDYEWVDKGTISAVGVQVDITKCEIDKDNKDTLKIYISGDSKSSGKPGFISISGAKIYVPDDAKQGDEVELTVDGNEVTKETIVIAKVGDYSFEVEVKGDIPTVVAGQEDQDVADIVIDDVVDGSWVEGRSVKLTLPSYAKWYKLPKIAKGENVIKDKITLNDDEDELKFTAAGVDGKIELEDLVVTIDADAPAGDLVVKISGSQGIEEEIVVAKVVPPFTVTAEKPNFVIGVQKQELGKITITESQDGAIEEGKWIIIKAPNGMEFAETPTVEVTDGDIEIDDEDIDENYFAFRVTADSAKKASTITISDIVMNLDRTVPTGDVEFEINMTKAGKDKDGNSYVKDIVDDNFSKAIDKDNYDRVTKVAVATVVTPAPGAATAEFTIGSTIYYVDGKAQILEAAPYIKNGRTYIPVRAAAEATGAVVNYDEATKTVTATKDGKEIVLVIGQVGASGVAPEIVNGRTFVPIRDLEGLGLKLGFDNLTKKVVVSSL